MLCANFDENSPVILEKILYNHQYLFRSSLLGIMRHLQVIAFCLKNALFLTTHQTMINKRKYNCPLDTHLYGQMYYNVTGLPTFFFYF